MKDSCEFIRINAPPDKRARPGSKGLESTGEPVTCSNRSYRCNGSQGWRESGETVLSRAAEGSVILHATFPKRDFIKCFKSGTASARGTQLLRFFLREHAKAAANHRLPLTTTILPSQSPADASTSCRGRSDDGHLLRLSGPRHGTARRRRGWPPPRPPLKCAPLLLARADAGPSPGEAMTALTTLRLGRRGDGTGAPAACR